MPMIPYPSGVTRTAAKLFLANMSAEITSAKTFRIYPTEYTWAAIPPVGSSSGLMRQTRRIKSLVIVSQGGIGLIARSPTEGQVWPRGNPEIRDD